MTGTLIEGAGGVEIPTPWDPYAELVVIGCAVATQHGADLARARLTVNCFFRAAYRDVFGVLGHLDGVSDEAARVARAAAMAEVDPRIVEEAVAGRCVMADTGGSYGRKVRDWAWRRWALAGLADAYNALAVGEPGGDIVGRLGAVVEELASSGAFA